ncbi:hypothetical protein MLD52_23530, partial [Puniceicoccaceae bacterium K14]|nr:hypothetical protein [Puniceicoccaceae bacterium K14]MCH6259548.1 hypothetical protein [Puniceicoccaceae bacterium K14]
PAEIIRVPIAMGAEAIVLVHNHPSGDPTPSKADRELTRRIKGYCDDLGMTICDHVIIGEGKYFSFNDEGLLKKKKKS